MEPGELIALSRSFTEDTSYDINMVRGTMRLTADALEAALLRISELEEALEAIKEFGDADDAFLCWKTANDALAVLSPLGG